MIAHITLRVIFWFKSDLENDRGHNTEITKAKNWSIFHTLAKSAFFTYLHADK